MVMDWFWTDNLYWKLKCQDRIQNDHFILERVRVGFHEKWTNFHKTTLYDENNDILGEMGQF